MFLPVALIGEMRGVRPISPHITISVSSSSPRDCEIVEKAAQATIDRRQQVALQIAKRVLMRVPAAQVDLHHPHAGLDQSPRDQKRLAPFLAAVQIAGRVGLLRQVERIVLALLAQDQIPGLAAIDVHAVARPASLSSVRRARSRSAKQRRAALQILDAQPRRQSQVGQMKIGIAATALSHQAPGCLPGRAPDRSADRGRNNSGTIRRRRACGKRAPGRRASGHTCRPACPGRCRASGCWPAESRRPAANRTTRRPAGHRRSPSRSTATRSGAAWAVRSSCVVSPGGSSQRPVCTMYIDGVVLVAKLRRRPDGASCARSRIDRCGRPAWADTRKCDSRWFAWPWCRSRREFRRAPAAWDPTSRAARVRPIER